MDGDHLPIRSATAAVEFYSTLQLLVMKKYVRSKLYQRLFWLRKRWQDRVAELALAEVLNPTLALRASNCWPCSLPEKGQWRCLLKCCPFCFARSAAYTYQVLSKVAKNHTDCHVWYYKRVNEHPFDEEMAVSVADAGVYLDKFLRQQWNLKRRLRGAYGGVYKTLLLPYAQSKNALKLQQGVIALVPEGWQPPIEGGKILRATNKGLIAACSYYFRYSNTWFDEPPRIVAYALVVQKNRKLQKFFGECKGVDL